MVSVRRWWGERSRAERFDVSLRWPLYGLAGAEPLVAVLFVIGEQQVRAVGAAVFILVCLAHTAAAVSVLRAGIGAYLGGPRPSIRLLAVAVGLTVIGVLAGDLAFPRFAWFSGDSDTAQAVFMLLSGFLTLAVAPLFRIGALLGVVLAGGIVVAGLTGAVQAGGLYVYLVGLIAVTYRVSVWTLGLGWEIDRSRAVAAQLAIAEERLRFARDLHDTLGRNLSLVAVQSELAAALATRGDEHAAEQMLEVRRIAHESLRELRAVVGGYRSTGLDSELAGAQSVLRSAGISCRVVGDGSGLPPATQVALGWVVREATTNVIRHSNATTCKIELEVTPDASILRVQNDGVNSSRASGGAGLTGLRERLAEVGGTLTAEEPPGQFVLAAWLPAAR
ncbi:sensor histidine kinase [Kribbella sp. C-35]|uniref:sensor histidine kinase n=1 Tax=Kribbella sp. C-35 TaxID=2789276 RepID=UPI00397E27A8